MTDLAPQQQTLIPAPVDSRREYVAGSSHWLAYQVAVRALPHAVDDLERELGDDLYTRMRTDPRVRGDLRLLVEGALEDGITVTPAVIPEGDDAAAATAAEAAAFVERCLEHLTIPLLDVLRDLALDALTYGCKLAEQVYADGTEDDAGRLVLKALKPKTRKRVAFAVDAYDTVVGILAATPGRPLSAGSLFVGQVPPDNLLPRSKFAILTHGPQDSDPRGSTVLRAAYNWWWIKTQLLPELLKYGAQFGTPSLAGTTAPNATPTDPSLSAEAELLEQLLAFQGGTAIAVPAGTLLQILQASQVGGDGFFERMVDLCDRQISTAIYGATRATQEARNGSRADSDTAKDLFDNLVTAVRQSLARMLQHDVVTPLLAANNTAWAAAPPVVSVGGVEAEDRTPAWTAVAQLERAGYLDPSQYPALDAELGLPVRTPEEVEARRQRQSAPPPPTTSAAPADLGADDDAEEPEDDTA